jgi:RNA-binding protein
MSEELPAELSASERKRLRGQAMRLKPAVIIGRSGVTPTVIAAIDTALSKDPLVKLRIEAPDRATRKSWLQEAARSTASTICGEVGHTASIYRPAKQSTE